MVAVRKVAPVLMGVMLSACTVVGIRSGTEEPKYEVVGHVGAVEIRRYAPRIAAETVVEGTEEQARSAGFRRLAGFIFGANHAGASIAMTAPVAQAADAAGGSERIAMTAPVGQARRADGTWTIRFFMPSRYTMASLPVPNDPSVRLVTVPAETFAVLRFSGVPSSERVATWTGRLLTDLHTGGWKLLGAPMGWFYDPPWTIPILRRNEVAVQVAD